MTDIIQISCIKEVYTDLVEQIHELNLEVLSAAIGDDSITLIIGGDMDGIALLEDFINGEPFA